MSASLYESHVTVRRAGPDEFARLRRWAAAGGFKLTHIVLARGRMRDQPMLTLSGSPSYACESARAREVAVLLAERHPLRYELLHEVFRLSGEWPYPCREQILLEDVVEAVGYVEWNHFVTEYPRFGKDEREFAERLVRAVTPAFEGGGA
ncbi:hypothetical protein ACSNOJ_08495 [Streptomyces sp. URMC 128]|uniref:hypothetical protein n=1 Tax=Streptomyces sp. URMC 128 TaxID=3423404 RepID=UPI003F1DED35